MERLKPARPGREAMPICLAAFAAAPAPKGANRSSEVEK